MKCSNCGGNMEGNGYSKVLHCEFADEGSYEHHEPDANPVMCDLKFPDFVNITEGRIDLEALTKPELIELFRGIMDLLDSCLSKIAELSGHEPQ